MPTAADMLGFLKWASIALGLASTLWGLLGRKPTTEDEHGKKRLTQAGMVTIGILLVASLISSMSFGFETLAKQEQNRASERKADEQQRAAERKDRDERNAQALRDARTAAIEANGRAARAEAHSASLEQRTLILAEANEARLRDLELSQTVNRSAAENLSRTGVALTQIERLLEPLGKPQIILTWELRRDAPGAVEALARIQELARRIHAGDPDALASIGMAGTAPEYAARLPNFVLMSGDPAYPTAANDPVLYRVMQVAGGRISFMAGGVPTTEGLAAIGAGASSLPSPLFRVGDLRYALGKSQPSIIYDYRTGAIQFETPLSANSTSTSTGAILSVADLKTSTVALDSAAGPRPSTGVSEAARRLRLQLQPLRLRIIISSNRVFDLGADRFRKTPSGDSYFVYTAGPLGEPTPD